MSEFSSVYKILAALRQRPGMFLGPVEDPCKFSALQAFLSGLSFSDLDPGSPSVWEFGRWITRRIDGISTTMPWSWLVKQIGPMGVYEAYFTYLDEYKACRETALLYAQGVSFLPRFTLGDSTGRMDLPPPIPKRLWVGQFAPSQVYYLAEDYGHNVRKEFPFQYSVEEVLQVAEGRWSVPASAWVRPPIRQDLPQGS